MGIESPAPKATLPSVGKWSWRWIIGVFVASAVFAGLFLGVVSSLVHRVESPMNADMISFLISETPGSGWVGPERQFVISCRGPGINVWLSKLLRPDSGLAEARFIYQNGGVTITARVYFGKDRVDRVELFGPGALSEVKGFQSKMVSAFPGLRCRVVSSL